METKEALKEYGLSEKEIEVYLNLLPLGKIKLQGIAKRVSFPRTTVYNTLTYLAEKGLISKITKSGVTYFEATDPVKLKDTLERKKKIVESVLPELEGLKKIVKESSNVEMFEGAKGLSTILSDVFKVKEEVCYFGSYSLSLEVLKHLPAHFRNLRIERKVPARIVIDPYDEEDFHKKEYKKITEMRFLKELKDFPCMIFIYGKKVALYTVKGDLVGIIIKNEQVTVALKMVFEMYWKSAKD